MDLVSAELIVFAAIADHGSISAAARHLGMQKSSVSRTLALLEERYGQRLIERSTRHMRLTEAGSTLLDYARRVAEEVEAAEAAMANLSAEPAGTLTVTAPHSAVHRLVVSMLPDFLRRYPKIRIGIDVSLRLVDLIAEGVDVAIRLGPLPSSSLIARPIGKLPLILAAAPEYLERAGVPRSVADLTRHRVVTIGTRIAPVHWSFEAAGQSVDVTPSIAVDEAGLVREMAVAGLGIVRLAEVVMREDIMAGRLVQVLADVEPDAPTLYAVYPSRRALAPKVTVFVDAVAAMVAAEHVRD